MDILTTGKVRRIIALFRSEANLHWPELDRETQLDIIDRLRTIILDGAACGETEYEDLCACGCGASDSDRCMRKDCPHGCKELL